MIDTSHTAWVLSSAALVLLMILGLAFFYGGLVRRKNAAGTVAGYRHHGSGGHCVGVMRLQSGVRSISGRLCRQPRVVRSIGGQHDEAAYTFTDE